MRYSICYTPSQREELTLAGGNWLGRSIYSGEPMDHPSLPGLGLHELAFYTAIPRREGFCARLKAPFRLAEERTEAQLLKALMHFAGTLAPFHLPALEIVRFGDQIGMTLSERSYRLEQLAEQVLQAFDEFRAPIDEDELDRMATDGLNAEQFANLYRWGEPHVLGEFRFLIPLTSPLEKQTAERVHAALASHFQPVLAEPPLFCNLALLVEREPGAPFIVHSLHPMGRVSARRIA